MDLTIREETLMDLSAELSIFDDDDSENDSFAGTQGDVKEAKEDIKLMNVVRAIVILILLTFAFISAEAAFVIMTTAEENHFEDGYANAADQLISSFYERLDTNLWVARTLSSDFASVHGLEWPFVTIDNFHDKCQGPRYLSKASSIRVDTLVKSADRQRWEEFMASSSLNLTKKDQDDSELSSLGDVSINNVSYYPTFRTLGDGIYHFEEGQAYTVATGGASTATALFPISQVSPPRGTTNQQDGIIGTLFDESSNPVREKALEDMMRRKASVLSNFLYKDTQDADFAIYATPRSSLYYPIFETTSSKQVVASVNMEFDWNVLLGNTMGDDSDVPVLVVVENSCGGLFTFNVTGTHSVFGGEGDLHTVKDGYSVQSTSTEAVNKIFNQHALLPVNVESECMFKLTVYPSQDFKDSYNTWRPEGFRGIILGTFFFIVLIFVTYDVLIERRQSRVVVAAERSDAIVRSLFPSNVRDRLYEQAKQREEKQKLAAKENWLDVSTAKGANIDTQKNKLKRFMNNDDDEDRQDDPIADLFPNTTILFADIAGFTAWSSEREPSQVFTLLETIYRSMDKAAKAFGVFKVETVGDCYVAATGIPDPQTNHAELMVRFARTTCVRIQQLTVSLEAQLGPGTAELGMRFGLHSGPVTAGVLRGQKARFQLFGDTMNMAARMESNSHKNKILVSDETAKVLSTAGKGNWIFPREDTVYAKGKGNVQTHWVRMACAPISDISEASSQNDGGSSAPSQRRMSGPGKNAVSTKIWEGTGLEAYLGKTELDPRIDRLVDWNVELLAGMLKSVVAQRIAKGAEATQIESGIEEEVAGDLVLDEVRMVIEFPDFDAQAAARAAEVLGDIELPLEVKSELRQYVAAIASGYWDNPFHDFEHASHVILSANKLLKRIQSLDDDKFGDVLTSYDVHEHTYGIGTDPLTQFTLAFAALVHDVGHTGVPNTQLSQDDPDLAEKYVFKSIAEQHSVDLAWDLLMLPAFKNLRSCIYQDRGDCERFRSLLVNSVIATDIWDKELKALRSSRWQQSFDKNAPESPMTSESLNRKATVVIDHLIQASDVAHTLSHWYIYQKWNEKLFKEMYFAFLSHRAEKDPSIGWYNGEIWFFDNYVIPLANRLKECGVFGVTGDEFLNYALQNRREWEAKGREVVDAMKRRAIEQAETMNLVRMGVVVEHSEVSMSHFDDEEPYEVQIVSPRRKLVERTTTSILKPGKRIIIAPPGRLGITIDTTESGQVVHSVESDSPLKDQIHSGEYIIAINDVVTKSMSSDAISALLQASVDHEKRFVVEA